MAKGTTEKTDKGKKTGLLALFVAAVATAAAFGENVEKLERIWCESVGFVCEYDLASPIVTKVSGGTARNSSDECKEHVEPICLKPSTKYRALLTESAKFTILTQSGGALLDGGPPGSDPVGTHRIGWYVIDNTPEKACVNVFARTSACETTVSLTGKLIAREKWKWRPW